MGLTISQNRLTIDKMLVDNTYRRLISPESGLHYYRTGISSLKSAGILFRLEIYSLRFAGIFLGLKIYSLKFLGILFEVKK